MKMLPITPQQFDAQIRKLELLTHDWAQRELSSFDEAVGITPNTASSTGSIWDMPTIDSKRVVSLLAEYEVVLGCKLPCALIKSGGYDNESELRSHLFSGIRERCINQTRPGLVDAAPPTSQAPAENKLRSQA